MERILNVCRTLGLRGLQFVCVELERLLWVEKEMCKYEHI